MTEPDWQKRIKEQYKPNLAKRFYKSVEVIREAGQYSITLDGRKIKTPLKATLLIPTAELAKAIKREWDEQGELINPHTMHLTKFTNTGIDRVAPRQSTIIAEIVEYAANDLLCYRANAPRELVTKQAEAFDPLLKWLHDTHKAQLSITDAIIHADQSEASLNNIAAALKNHNPFELTAIHIMTALSGSAILAMAVIAGHIDADTAFSAACIEEDWNFAHWGEDAEAVELRKDKLDQFRAISRFIDLLHA